MRPPEKPQETRKKKPTERTAGKKKANERADEWPDLTFAEAFNEISKAKTVEDLDRVRSQIKHSKTIPEDKQGALGTMLDNKVLALQGKTEDLE